MILQVIHTNSSKNYTIKIRGPVNMRTTHHDDYLVLLRKYTYRYRYHSKQGQTYYKLILNKKALKAQAAPDHVGLIQWEVDCPVCLKSIEPRPAYDRERYGHCQGNTYSMEYNEFVRAIALPNHEGVVVCSQQCHDLFALSPQIYEDNYL